MVSEVMCVSVEQHATKKGEGDYYTISCLVCDYKTTLRRKDFPLVRTAAEAMARDHGQEHVGAFTAATPTRTLPTEQVESEMLEKTVNTFLS